MCTGACSLRSRTSTLASLLRSISTPLQSPALAAAHRGVRPDREEDRFTDVQGRSSSKEATWIENLGGSS